MVLRSRRNIHNNNNNNMPLLGMYRSNDFQLQTLELIASDFSNINYIFND